MNGKVGDFVALLKQARALGVVPDEISVLEARALALKGSILAERLLGPTHPHVRTLDEIRERELRPELHESSDKTAWKRARTHLINSLASLLKDLKEWDAQLPSASSPLTTLRTEYKRAGKIPPCRLAATDLNNLDSVLTEGLTGPVSREYTVRLPQRRISAESLAELLTAPDLPTKLPNLEITVSSRLDRAWQIYAFILLDTSVPGGYSVSGSDELLVLGKAERLAMFWREKSAGYRLLYRFGKSLPTLLPAMGTVLAIANITLGGSSPFVTALVWLLLLMGWATYFIVASPRLPYAYIAIKPSDKSTPLELKFTVIILIVETVAMIISLVALLVALIK